MKFGPVPVGEAEGAVLAYAVTTDQGRLPKGSVLTARDLAALWAAGHETITVARYEQGDISEDAAAAILAAALAADGVRVSQAATGRVNLYATGPGIVWLDVAAIEAFNAVNPMITVATLPQYARVDAGVMIATIKIISYAVPAEDAATAARQAKNAIAVLSPQMRKAALIETALGDTPSPKGENALRARLDRLGVTLAPRVVVPHQANAVAAALGQSQADVAFVLTASATSDVADVGPRGVIDAGGTVSQFGMPVDPGNLIFLGALGSMPVIGLPGCARSPALNGADWVLERVICGVPPTPADFARMGVGGLLKEIPSRPKPREAI